MAVEPWFIKKLKSLGVAGQPIRDDGPKDHFSKKGTPTMGGLVMIVAIIISTLLFCDLTNKYVWLSVGVMSAYAYLGFIDDWKKIKKQDSYQGLTERQKLIWQIIIASVAAVVLSSTGFPTSLGVPFLKDIIVPLGIFFVPFAVLVIVGTSNAVNLTDGLDGLAIGPIITVALTYVGFCYITGHAELAKYLWVQHISGLGETSIILASVLGAGLGFLWYNTYPAQVFMGDTGALALGSLLGLVAVFSKQELVLVVAGGIFVVEALSVLIQRYSYKLRKKRVFKMAPLHHHFELGGWPEPKIIVRFWIISLILAILSLSTLKLR